MRRRRGYVFTAALLALIGLRAAAGAAPTPAPATSHTPVGVEAAPTVPGGETLGQQVEALRTEVGELRTLQDPARAQAPPWAVDMKDQLDRRIERMAEMQERLAARIETPSPRLDEPIVLFTVAGCTLLLGFVVGRGVQRRSNRRDLRLRL
jgi:hypothetical protein